MTDERNTVDSAIPEITPEQYAKAAIATALTAQAQGWPTRTTFELGDAAVQPDQPDTTGADHAVASASPQTQLACAPEGPVGLDEVLLALGVQNDPTVAAILARHGVTDADCGRAQIAAHRARRDSAAASARRSASRLAAKQAS